MTVSPEFERGIAQFNQQDFYACHDTLEAIWVDAVETDKRFYQGILQVAVGCYHLSNDNLRGAIILLGEATRRLCDYQPDYESVDVERLLTQSLSLLSSLQQLKPEQAQDFWQMIQPESEKIEVNDDAIASLAAGCQLPKIDRV